MTRWVHPNVGGEEPLSGAPPPVVACVARLFTALFPNDTRRSDDGPAARDGFGFRTEGAAFRWLARDPALYAWWNDAEAARLADAHGVPLVGAAPDVARAVHDKAFALETCRDEGYEARSLRGLCQAFGPEELADADGFVATLQRRLADWPAWTGGRFTLKPRLGASGRGRVGGLRGGDFAELRRALPRLARQGGALLEPWLERERDLSVQLFVDGDGTLTLLGSLVQQVSASGVYRGHTGRLDHRLRVASGCAEDADVLDAACAVARAAHARGFRGPCGVDAFVFRGPDGPELRPVVELNARFTMGTLVAGLLRLARPALRKRLPAGAGETRHFRFALTPPEAEPADGIVLPLGRDDGGFGPALVVLRSSGD
ncbi:MAG: hypothetical protein ACQGVC_23760 [Myxococcota bacterium]